MKNAVDIEMIVVRMNVVVMMTKIVIMKIVMKKIPIPTRFETMMVEIRETVVIGGVVAVDEVVATLIIEDHWQIKSDLVA